MVDSDVATQAELDAEAATRAAAVAASNVKLSGDIVQVVTFQTGLSANGSVAIPQDNTIPQITEGFQFLSQAFTPTDALNTLLIDVCITLTCNAANTACIALFQNGVNNALACVAQGIASTNALNPVLFRHKMVAGTTSSITFSVRAGTADSSTLHMNGLVAGQLYGGVFASSITITEIKA
jgi:hypothetical protein